MLYVFEGLDGTGKTALVKALSEKMNKLGIQHISIKESVTKDEEEKRARIGRMLQIQSKQQTAIYDRATLIDDLVYKPIMEQQPSQIELFDVREVLEHKAVVFYLEAPLDVLYERLQNRGDEYIPVGSDLKNLLYLLETQYKTVFATMGITVVKLNAELPTSTLVDQVIPWVKSNMCQQGLAHIVNKGNLNVLDTKPIVMSLAHLVHQDKRYATFYRSRCHTPTFVIMDNGAAERSQVDMETLYKCYEVVRPDEIILPDTLCNRLQTLKQFNKAIDFFCNQHDIGNTFIMAVPQGSNFEEWKKCARVMIQEPKVKTLGVTKFLVQATNDSYIRYQAVKYIDELRKEFNRPDITVHLLGWVEEPAFIGNLFELFPFVRSCDSCFGYLAAKNEQHLYPTSSRPAGEIDFLSEKEIPYLSSTLNELEIATGIMPQ